MKSNREAYSYSLDKYWKELLSHIAAKQRSFNHICPQESSPPSKPEQHLDQFNHFGKSNVWNKHADRRTDTQTDHATSKHA